MDIKTIEIIADDIHRGRILEMGNARLFLPDSLDKNKILVCCIGRSVPDGYKNTITSNGSKVFDYLAPCLYYFPDKNCTPDSVKPEAVLDAIRRLGNFVFNDTGYEYISEDNIFLAGYGDTALACEKMMCAFGARIKGAVLGGISGFIPEVGSSRIDAESCFVFSQYFSDAVICFYRGEYDYNVKDLPYNFDETDIYLAPLAHDVLTGSYKFSEKFCNNYKDMYGITPEDRERNICRDYRNIFKNFDFIIMSGCAYSEKDAEFINKHGIIESIYSEDFKKLDRKINGNIVDNMILLTSQLYEKTCDVVAEQERFMNGE